MKCELFILLIQCYLKMIYQSQQKYILPLTKDAECPFAVSLYEIRGTCRLRTLQHVFYSSGHQSWSYPTLYLPAFCLDINLLKSCLVSRQSLHTSILLDLKIGPVLFDSIYVDATLLYLTGCRRRRNGFGHNVIHHRGHPYL